MATFAIIAQKLKHFAASTKRSLVIAGQRFAKWVNPPRLHDHNLLETYVGKSFDKFTRRRFNLAGFFFTSIYLFYRKLYGTAILVFALQIALVIATKNLVLPSLEPNLLVDFFHQIVFGLLVGFLVNPYYLWAAQRKISRLNLKFPSISRAELRGICRIKGGTNLGVAIIGLVLELIISAIVGLVLAVETIVIEIDHTVEHIEHDIHAVVDHEIRLSLPTVQHEIHLSLPSTRHEIHFSLPSAHHE